MNKLYDRIDFVNNTTPALNETNLDLMSKAIDDIDDRVIDIADDVLVVVPEILDKYADIEALATNPPYIGVNGDWWVWDTNTNQYVDSGVDAGVSVNVGTTTTLAPGSSATVTNSGTDTDPILNFGIPQGAAGQDGQDGTDGQDGVSPEVTITTITDGHTVTITDADHPAGQSFNVMDGTNGQGVPASGTTGQVLTKASNADYDTTWTTPSGGSGGHTIINSAGTNMTQRTGLQFVGADVTDDSANDKTIVKTTPQSMIGDAWASGHAYAVGDYCIDGNVLYKCKTAHTSSASNRPPYASYWDAVSVASELQAIRNKLILPHLFYRGYSNTAMGSMTGISGHSGKSLSVVDDYLTGGNAGNAWYGTYFSNPVNLSDCNRIYVEIENTAIMDSSTSAMYQLVLFNTTPVWNGGYVSSVFMDRQGDPYAINYSQGTHIFCKDLSSFSASQKANTYVGIGFIGNSTNSHIKQIWVA